SLRKAADHTGVKFQTLARYVNKQKAAGNNNVRMTPNYAVRRVFTDADEQELAEYIKTTARMCFGLTTVDTRKLAFEMAQKNNLDFPQQWSENKLAGKDWLRGFIQRNPRISIRQPEACSLSRMTSFNKHNVNQFYENLKLIYSRNSSVLCAATRIFNLDETGTPIVSASKAILAEKGVKQISKATSGERGLLITTCAIVCAAGTFLPPAMVFPRCNFKISHVKWCSTPGLLVMEHFIKHSSSSKENPSLLIFDNHESHMSLKVLDLARENGVTILTLPPHCSHKMQPLECFWQPCTLYNVSSIG
uniref:DDE-1 domain-containing protein n=1 Tax=Ciona savignyi TaxID=51511 RepID=H2YFE2_CIOSA